MIIHQYENRQDGVYLEEETDSSGTNLILYASAQSYQINGFGHIELDSNETRRLYEAMRDYYGRIELEG